MRMMKSPMAVRNPSTSGETEEQKLHLKFGLMRAYSCVTEQQLNFRGADRQISTALDEARKLVNAYFQSLR